MSTYWSEVDDATLDDMTAEYERQADEERSAWDLWGFDEAMEQDRRDAEQEAEQEAAGEYMDLWDLLDDIGGVVSPDDYLVLTLADLRRIAAYYVQP